MTAPNGSFGGWKGSQILYAPSEAAQLKSNVRYLLIISRRASARMLYPDYPSLVFEPAGGLTPWGVLSFG
jgi:hypothetical protein